MIRITVERDQQRRIDRVVIRGHARFGEYGQDIVCAGVSAISIGLVNACETLLGVRLHQDDDADGKLDCRVPDGLDPETDDRVRFLMEAMVTALQSVAQEYSSYVHMEER